MNCKQCGAKLGILERWRYGDFCTLAHKDSFADDQVHLNEQIVRDLRRIPHRLNGPAGQAVADAAAETSVEEPAPPEASFVEAPPAAPLPPAVESARPEPAPAPRAKGDRWREFAKVVDSSLRPSATLEASANRRRHVVWVTRATDPVSAAHGALLSGQYPAFLPDARIERWRGHLPMALHSDPSVIVRPASAVSMERKYWVDEQGWRWIPAASPTAVPSFAPVLAEYPLVSPWQGWSYATGDPIGVAPGLAPLSGGASSVAGGSAPAPASPPASAATGPQGGSRSGLAAQPPGISHGSLAGAPRGIPAEAAWPGGPPWADGMGACAFQGAIPAEAPWSAGLVWRELPPPLFNALVDPSHSLQPLRGQILLAAPLVQSLPAHVPPTPGTPASPSARTVAWTSIDRQESPLTSVVPAWNPPVPCDWQRRTLWRRALVYPTHRPRLSQPGIPRLPAPRLRLRMRATRPAPVAVPVLHAGRWID